MAKIGEKEAQLRALREARQRAPVTKPSAPPSTPFRNATAKGKAGRPKRHASNAERQRAHRQRQKEPTS